MKTEQFNTIMQMFAQLSQQMTNGFAEQAKFNAAFTKRLDDTNKRLDKRIDETNKKMHQGFKDQSEALNDALNTISEMHADHIRHYHAPSH